MDVEGLDGRTAGSAQAGRTPAAGGVATAELSRMAALMNELQELEAQAPDRFRRAMGAISRRLGAVAGREPGGTAELLRALSRKFGEAGGGAGEAGGPPAAPARPRAAPQARAPQLEEILQSALDELEA